MSHTYHKNEKSNFDWNQIVTKSVETSDGKDIGKVDGLEDIEFVVKDGLIDPKYYRIPREDVESYENGKVKLSLSEDDVKTQFERSNPGYYSQLSDNGQPGVGNNNSSERTSNTIS
jgi:hypothetical protein